MLRRRANKRYVEETSDEKDEGGRTYNLKEKIRSPRFEQIRDLQKCPGEAVSLKHVQKNGFDKPILVESPAGLDLRVPPRNFTVRDVGKLVGYDRLIDVMDVRTQKNIEMTMKEWCKYYDSRQRDRLLNVISLEFSHTDLDDLIDSPKIVKHLDWVDMVWPKFLKESQIESTNKIDRMKYPKVQKYCLMSVKGSYTDFHIDFGGTSVWYHILKGKKIFWMCPPTELNMQAFEEWTLSGMQQDVFFGDTVEECFRVELSAGNTFFIPSGWIHAVYTVEDSLVFGGNFLHSFGIENQLKVSRIEDATKVPVKFRYPFYTEILWYVVQHYVHCLTGRSHLHSTTSTPEKSSQLSTEKRKKVSRSGDTTESEQDECDNKNQKVSRRRGRPFKSSQNRKQKKPPTDDESTEIDSDFEDVKPNKSTTTCRMTKNSLLRLQYEVDEPRSITDTVDKRSSDKLSRISPAKDSISPLKKSESNDHQTDLSLSLDNNRSNLSHMILSQEAMRSNGSSSGQQVWSHRESESKEPSRIHITKHEVNGLRILIKYLSKLSGAKKNLPTLIRNSRTLLDECKKVVIEHENDDPELAATGIPITLDLLNPKKSDISQLIEQFFKTPENSNCDSGPVLDSPNSIRTKCDSTTLTQQQRLKYMQPSIETKNIEKKSLNTSVTSDANPSVSDGLLRDHKNPSHSKKSSSISCPSSAATSNNSTDLPRPKSPPTRPVSNKQYVSKTKKDIDLNLPDSFADLIAATSAPKEVFNVSSAEVTSSLFSLKPSSPTKTATSNMYKVKQRTSSIDASPTKPQNDQDHDLRASSPLSGNKSSSQPASKSISPEPPKIQPPLKRFINPTYKPQAKEKLVFASAPYVSPAHNLESSKSLHPYPWQNSAPTPQPSSQRPNLPVNQPAWQPTIRQETAQSSYVAPNPEPSKRSSTETQPIPLKQEYTHKAINEKMDVSIRPINAIQTASKYKPKDRITDSDLGRSSSCQKTDISINSQNHNSTLNSRSNSDTDADMKSGIPSPNVMTKQSTSFSIDRLMAPSIDKDGDKAKKTHAPRGPLKKFKGARQAFETDAEKFPSTSIPVSVMIAKASSVKPESGVQTKTKASEESTSKSKKAPRPKKKVEDATQSVSTQTLSNVTQTLPRVICRLVAPSTISSTNSTNVTTSVSSPHQYLISRPVLFNPMQPFTTTHLQQHIPQPALPIITTPVARSESASVSQPRARIVWATRPTVPVVPTSKVVNPAQMQSTSGQKSESSQPLSQKPADHAALLSLATTALSTAPLPTTPTLSHVGARSPSVSQAFMMNPMVVSQPGIFSGQPLFNPYLPQMPLLARPPFVLAGNPSQIMPGGLPKSNAPRPTGQLLFAPLPRPMGQPRYLITQPGFLPHRPQTAQLFATQQGAATLAFAPYRPAAVSTTDSESVKVKKVKTR